MFYRAASDIRHRPPRYCSPECYRQERWGGSRIEQRQCPICGETFSVRRSNEQKTCSHRCRSKAIAFAHAAEKSHLWRGGTTAPYIGDAAFGLFIPPAT